MKKETDTKPILKIKLGFPRKLHFKKMKPMPAQIVPTSIKEASIVIDLFQHLKIAKTNADFGMRMSKEGKVKGTDTKSSSIAKLKFAAKIPPMKKSMIPKIKPTNIKEEPNDIDFLLHLKTSKANTSLGLGRRIPKTEEKDKANAEQISFGATICGVSGSFAGLPLSNTDKEDEGLNFVDSMLSSMNLKTS